MLAPTNPTHTPTSTRPPAPSPDSPDSPSQAPSSSKRLTTLVTTTAALAVTAAQLATAAPAAAAPSTSMRLRTTHTTTYAATQAAGKAPAKKPVNQAPHKASNTASNTVGKKVVKKVGCAKTFFKRYANKTLPVAGLCGRRMSHVEMVTVLRKAGWSWKAMPNAMATFIGESGGYVGAYRDNRTATGRLLSTDVSWVQINNRYHPGITKVNYTDPVVAATYARTLAQRYGLRIWVAYRSRAQHMPAAMAAIRTARAHGVR